MCHEYMPTFSTRRVGYCGCRFRQFLSPKEEVDLLEGYKQQLQKEIEGVENRIKELKRVKMD